MDQAKLPLLLKEGCEYDAYFRQNYTTVIPVKAGVCKMTCNSDGIIVNGQDFELTIKHHSNEPIGSGIYFDGAVFLKDSNGREIRRNDLGCELWSL